VVVVDLGRLVFASAADADGFREAVRDAYLGRTETASRS
jgi:hypothetical protein